jgi:NADH-quinone oxidoreductase chain G
MEAVGVYINKKFIPVRTWESTVIELCDSLNLVVPRFCYHSKLSIAGNCRMCLIEVETSLKPVLACATTLSTNLSIRTHSDLVRKAREGVLEFLLINHPLDCPICDQAGECDLQDQSLIYGSDKGRFLEVKRSVEDKYFGPYVKSIMTRCIHCTRCVRFLEELTPSGSLGTMGRGKETEISQYLNKGILSGLSGNLIDICPVGALTSKPYAFSGRPWELKSVEVVDILDSMGSGVRIDLKGSEIMRVLPKKNDQINEDWIADKVRFAYDSYKRDRLSNPLYRTNGKYSQVSWNFTFSLIQNMVKSLAHKYGLSIHYGPLVDVYTSFLFSRLANKIPGKSNLFTLLNSKINSNWIINSFKSIEKYNTYFSFGSNFIETLPLLFNRIRKNLSTDQSANFVYFGKYKNVGSLSNVFQFGISTLSQTLFLLGKSRLGVSSLISRPSSLFLYDPMYESLTALLPTTVIQTCMSRGQLSEEVTVLSSGKTRPKGVVLLSNIHVLDTQEFEESLYLIYFGHHGTELSMHCHLILPTTSHLEESVPFYNLTGKMDWSRKVMNPIGVSIDSEVFLRRFYRSLVGDEYLNSYVDFLSICPDHLTRQSSTYSYLNSLSLLNKLSTSNKVNWTNDSVITNSSFLLKRAIL